MKHLQFDYSGHTYRSVFHYPEAVVVTLPGSGKRERRRGEVTQVRLLTKVGETWKQVIEASVKRFQGNAAMRADSYSREAARKFALRKLLAGQTRPLRTAVWPDLS